MYTSTSYGIYHNTKVKNYPQGFSHITVASRNVFRERGWEMHENGIKEFKPQNKENATRHDSLNRSRRQIYDIVYMNEDDFKYFVTLTIDPKKADSMQIDEVIHLLRSFLKNMTSRYGLKYILIPEHHKSGRIHLHGLFNESIKMIDSGTRKVKGHEKPMKLETMKRKNIPLEGSQIVYNLPQWKYGYSTAIEKYGDTSAVANYITKYITKDLMKIFGNFYYAGGNINREVPFSLCDSDYDSFEYDKQVYCEAAHTGFKYLTTDKAEM